MAREKKNVHKVEMTEGKRNIIQMLLQEYDIESAQDIQDALKDLLGGTIKEMMEAEMEDHLGYGKSSVPTMMTTAMATKANRSTAAMEAWKLLCHRTGNPPLSYR